LENNIQFIKIAQSIPSLAAGLTFGALLAGKI
jgi:hypothetical protein